MKKQLFFSIALLTVVAANLDARLERTYAKAPGGGSSMTNTPASGTVTVNSVAGLKSYVAAKNIPAENVAAAAAEVASNIAGTDGKADQVTLNFLQTGSATYQA